MKKRLRIRHMDAPVGHDLNNVRARARQLVNKTGNAVRFTATTDKERTFIIYPRPAKKKKGRA